MNKVFTEKAPKPAGHYSQATECNGFVFISGQLPVDPITGKKELGSLELQTKQVLKNVDEILKEANCSREDVLKVTVYISDITFWDEVDKVYSDFFASHKPARAVVPTRDLHYGFKIEIEAIAYKGK